MPRPRKPNEQKRKTGNPGKRALPAESEVVALTPVVDPGEVPPPDRPLGSNGMREWERVWKTAWAWLSDSDIGAVQRYCEAVDDYVILRNEMLRAIDAQADNLWRLRKQVQDAGKHLDAAAGRLGLDPSGRAVLGLAEVRAVEAATSLMDRTQGPSMRTIDID